MTELRVTVTNTSNAGGTFLTPFYFGFHDGNFDLFSPGEAASAGLEAAAEDGNFSVIAGERGAASPGSQGLVVFGNDNTPGTPIATEETTSATIDVDAELNTHVALVAMILPSNDAFVGNSDPLRLFSDSGRFLGAQTITFEGADVYDAGTELNTEEDAAFINQTEADTGIDENGVVRLHGGFNGSQGNPDGSFGFDPEGPQDSDLASGSQIILGGTNALGAEITEEADFTREGAQIAEIHINTVTRTSLEDGGEVFVGDRSDDLVEGGEGRDLIFGRAGFDVIEGNGGADFLSGGRGNDELYGGAGNDGIRGGGGDDAIYGGTGNDFVRAGSGDDLIDGGEGDDALGGNAGDDVISGFLGDDFLTGGKGDDVLHGGAGDDTLSGGRGDDAIVFETGDGDDTVLRFDRRGDDTLILNVEGIDSFEDVLDSASQIANVTTLDFGDAGSLRLVGTRLSDLDETDFVLPEIEALL